MSAEENISAEAQSPVGRGLNPEHASININDLSPAARDSILKIVEAESASKDSEANLPLQNRQSAEDVVSPVSQGDATDTNINAESIDAIVEELLEEGGISPTPSKGGKLINPGVPKGNSGEPETAVYDTPIRENNRLSEQGRSEGFQLESRPIGSSTRRQEGYGPSVATPATRPGVDDVPVHAIAKATSTSVKNFTETILNELIQIKSTQVQGNRPHIAKTLRKAKHLRIETSVGTRTLRIPIGLLIGAPLNERQIRELSASLITICEQICYNKDDNKGITTYFNSLEGDVRKGGDTTKALCEETIKTVRIQIGEIMSNFASSMDWFDIQNDIEKASRDEVDFKQIFGGTSSRFYDLFIEMLWKNSFVSKATFARMVEEYNSEIAKEMTWKQVSLKKISDMSDQYFLLVEIGNRFDHAARIRLIPVLSLIEELFEKFPSTMEERNVMDILSRGETKVKLLNGILPTDAEISRVDGDIKDARSLFASKVPRQAQKSLANNALLIEPNDQPHHEGNPDNVNINKTPNLNTKSDKPKGGCTNIPRSKRTDLQKFIVDQGFTAKTEDGKKYCISYNIARLTLKKNHSQAEQACHDYNGTPSNNQKCSMNCIHKLMDTSKFIPKTKQGDGSDEPNED